MTNDHRFCVSCGTRFETLVPNRLRCAECEAIRQRERSRESKRRSREAALTPEQIERREKRYLTQEQKPLHVCIDCGTPFPVGTYSRRQYCEMCKKQHRARWYREHKEHLQAYNQEYYARPDIQERKKEYQREYSQRPEIKERLRDYQREHRVKKPVQSEKQSIPAQSQPLCAACQKPIPEEKLKKRSRLRPPTYCSKDCRMSALAERNRQNGHFHRMSKAGMEVHKRIQAETGRRPGYEARAKHARELNARRGKGRQIE